MSATGPTPRTGSAGRRETGTVLERVVVVALTVLSVAQSWQQARPLDVVETAGVVAIGVGCLALVAWRAAPYLVAVGGLGLLTLAVAALGAADAPDLALPVVLAYFAVVGATWDGLWAWVGLAGLASGLVAAELQRGTFDVGLLMFSVPGYLAGLAFRLRRRTAEQLAARVVELEAERELYAQLSVRAERTRIAAELHDVVGHALSVMVVQAAAGQRLVERDPASAERSLEAIAESARQGRADLQRLVDLLGGAAPPEAGLALVDDAVRSAARAGLDVRCVLAGDLDAVPAASAHVAFRVVQEALTNALRHAPGSAVRVRVEAAEGSVSVLVENTDPPTGEGPALPGAGRGLLGLGDRVRALGGTLRAGAVPTGGWSVRAELPSCPPPGPGNGAIANLA